MAHTILVVDDEPDIRMIMCDYFEDEYEGCKVVEAEDGVEALKKCDEQKFDMITTDFRMPNMNGGEFIKALRSGSSSNKDTPILFISGFVKEAQVEASTYKDVFFLEKPIKFHQVELYTKTSLGPKKG